MRWMVLLFLSTLAACAFPQTTESGPARPPPAPPTAVEIPTPQEPPKKPRRFTMLEDIYSQLDCESTDVIGPGNNRATLLDMGHCYQPWASLDVYLTRPRTVGSWAHMTGYEPGVVGPNWVILAGSEEAALVVQGLIGGEIALP